MRRHGPFIDGVWRSGDGGAIIVRDKFSEAAIGEVASSTPAEVDAASAAAIRAFEADPLPPAERFGILSRVSRAIGAESEELAALLVREVGKTIREARVEVASAVAATLDAAEEAKRIHGEVIPIDANPGSERRFAFTLRAPAGPVCAITPFNSPLNLAAHKAGSAIAAGDTVVVKPSELTPLTTIRLAELFHDAGLPPGRLNLVFGGAGVGAALCRDERFARYTFTGGQAAARKVVAAVGLRPVTLELGPAAPTFVHEDADLDVAVERCCAAAFGIAGQVCTSVQRLFVHESVAEPFLGSFLEAVGTMRLGDPAEESTDVGPMMSEEAAARAEGAVRDALAAGARLLCGGTREGRLFAPTVLAGVTPSMDVYRHEMFAPVVCIVPYASLPAATRLANAAGGGLQAGIFTRSLEVAFEFARTVRAGGVMINDTSRFRVANMPFGGVGDAGFGREGARFAIRELTDQKTVIVHL